VYLRNLTETNKYSLNDGQVLIDIKPAIARLRNWVDSDSGKSTLPPFDHVMLLTA